VAGNLAREYVDDISVSRMQENISRKFSQDDNAESSSCIGGSQTSLGNNSWRVAHGLKREPKGFVIIAQGSSTSIFAKMVNVGSTTADIVFESDPTSFSVSFF
jgi:hypothetical protein